MLKKYTQKEYHDLYESLPKKMQHLFWEDDISNRIEKISERFELTNKEIWRITEIIAHLFLGILPPEHISSVIQKEIILKEDFSKKLATEVIRFIVYPTQHLLKEVYSAEDFQNIGTEKINEAKKFNNRKEEDLYREPID